MIFYSLVIKVKNIMDDYMESIANLYGCSGKDTKTKNTKTKTTDTTYARGYIMGYIDALKKSDSPTHHTINSRWLKIDSIKHQRTRHRKTVEMYQELDFAN